MEHIAREELVTSVAPHSLIADRYRLLDVLGEGGMGVVWRAHDEIGRREVALKVLSPEAVGDARARERLLREAQSASAIAHRGLVTVLDAGVTGDGGAFLAMELVRGQSLRERARRPMPIEAVARIVEDVGDVLAAAHREDFVHRDVKPDNIMLDRSGRVVVLDLGLAKRIAPPDASTELNATHLRRLTTTGAIVGTPAYLAPEQARGHSVPQSDQWALAVTAYELLTGRLPFDGADSAHVLVQVLMDDPIPASIHRQGLHPEVDAVLGRALCKRPEDRYPSVEAFASALGRALRGGLETSDARTESDADASAEHPPSNAVDESGRAEPEAPTAVSAAVSPAPRSRLGPRRYPGHPGVWWRDRTGLWSAVALICIAAMGLFGWRLHLGSLFNETGSNETGSNETGSGEMASGEGESGATPSALAEHAVVACPVLETPDDPQARWLGAAAAHAVCTIVRAHRGADARVAQAPAALLGLPVFANRDVPTDPLSAPSIVEDTLREAQTRDAWITGSVRQDERGWFELSIELHHGRTQASAVGRGESLHLAAGQAVDMWLETGALPELSPRPWVRRFARDNTAAQERAALDVTYALLTGVGLDEACDRYIELGSRGAQSEETLELCGRRAPPRPFVIEGGDVVLRARARLEDDDATPEEFAELADAIGALHPELETDAIGWAQALESTLRRRAGQIDEANALLRLSILAVPTMRWRRIQLMRATRGTDDQIGLALSATYQFPSSPSAWRALSSLGQVEETLALESLRRAYRLGPGNPVPGLNLAKRLDPDVHRQELMTIAARYRAHGGRTRLAAEAIVAILACRDGRLGQAFTRLREGVLAQTRLGDPLEGDASVAQDLLYLARVLGRGETVANELIDRFAVPDRLYLSAPFYEPVLLEAASMSGLDRTQVVIDLLHSLRPARTTANELAIRALRSRVAQDEPDMRRAVREMVGARARPIVPNEIRIGSPELTARVERTHADPAMPGLRASLRDVARARECAAQESFSCAQTHARRVINAWTDADVDVPAVAEMRALLAQIPAE